MLMRGYTLFEESFYKDNKDLLEFIRIKRFYKNNGEDDEDEDKKEKNKGKNKQIVANNNENSIVNNETEAMRNNKKFLPKIDSNFTLQNARSLRKRINSPTYKLLCEVNDKFKTLGYRLSPPLLLPPRSREKSLEIVEKGENHENYKKPNSMIAHETNFKSPTQLDERGKSSDNNNKKKLEIWMPNILVEEIESENDDDEIQHHGKKKAKNNPNNETIMEEAEPMLENSRVEFHDKYEQNVYRNKPYLKTSAKGINSKTIYKLINNKQTATDSLIDDSSSKYKNDINTDLNSSSMDYKQFKETISPKLGKVFFSSKSGLLAGTIKQQNSDFLKTVKNEVSEIDSQKLKTTTKAILPPIMNSSFNSESDSTTTTTNNNNINKNNTKIDIIPGGEYNSISYRLARITEPLSRTTKTLIDNELDEMLSNKKQLQQQYDDFRQKIIDLRSTDHSNLSNDFSSITKITNKEKNDDAKYYNTKNNNSQLSSNFSASSSTTAAKLRYSKRVKETSFIREQKLSKLGIKSPESISKHKLDQNMIHSYVNRSQAFNEQSLARFNTESFIKLQQQQPRPLIRNPSFHSAQEDSKNQNFKKTVLSLHHPLKSLSKSQFLSKPKF